MKDKDLLSLVNSQYTESFAATTSKRDRMRDRLKYFINTAKGDDSKISIYMIRSYVKTLISLYYEDGLTHKFSSRDIYSYIEADNLNVVAEADYNLMKMDVTDYQVQFDRLVYGVGIRVFTGRDKDLLCPQFEIISPLDIYPDARGHAEINNFRYFGFERTVSLGSLRDMGYDHVDEVQAILSGQQVQNLQYYGENKEIYAQVNYSQVPTSMKAEYKDSQTTTIYYHYLIIDGEPHQAVTRNKGLLLSNKKIQPLVADKYAKKLMKFPIVLNYYEPMRGDPRGVSLFDVLEDKQKTKTLFLNLMRIKATKEALGGQMFIDRQIFMDNKTQLSKPTVGRQYLPVSNNNGSISNSVYAVPENPISPDVYNMRNILEQEAENDSGVSNTIRGMQASSSQTATEVKNNQMNSNINLVLGNKVNGRGERDFRTCRFYWYKYYLPDKAGKQISGTRGLMSVGNIFKRKDLFSGIDPSLEILNKGMLETKRKEEAQQFLNTVWTYLQAPDIKPISKRFLTRKAFRLGGMDSYEIELAVPYTPEEMDAKLHVLLLNKNIQIKVGDMSEDHYTYIVMYKNAQNTPAKFSAIEARKQAYIESGQANLDMLQAKDQSQGGMAGPANMMMNQEMMRQGAINPQQG